jgi:hypothetical protein
MLFSTNNISVPYPNLRLTTMILDAGQGGPEADLALEELS